MHKKWSNMIQSKLSLSLSPILSLASLLCINQEEKEKLGHKKEKNGPKNQFQHQTGAFPLSYNIDPLVAAIDVQSI